MIANMAGIGDFLKRIGRRHCARRACGGRKRHRASVPYGEQFFEIGTAAFCRRPSRRSIVHRAVAHKIGAYELERLLKADSAPPQQPIYARFLASFCRSAKGRSPPKD
jgi:hypothetical protein